MREWSEATEATKGEDQIGSRVRPAHSSEQDGQMLRLIALNYFGEYPRVGVS
jgi:hypothetical protein